MNQVIKTTLAFLFCAVQFVAARVSIVPLPYHICERQGTFQLTSVTSVEAAPSLSNEKMHFKQYVEENYGIRLAEQSSQSIRLSLVDKLPTDNPSGYMLSVSEQSVIIKALNPEGVFYALQTLKQLFEASPASIHIPCVEIVDYPRFHWRGMMLDEARYFKGKEVVKTLLTEMSKLKMNVFHWHLTDDQGWRIESKKYPQLTIVGSKRDSTQTNSGYDWSWVHSQWDGKPHSGYYTQEDIMEIINYAEKLHITIVPEIELLTHATAAIASYPYLGTTGKRIGVACNLGVMDEVMDISKDSVTQFTHDILDEIAALFPGRYIHIGGDELQGSHWKDCEGIQKLKQTLGITEDHELQLWYFNQISSYLKNKGKRLIGWSDFIGSCDKPSRIKADLVEGTVVQYWQGDHGDLEYCLNHSPYVVQSHRDFAYFNTSISQIYKSEIVPDKLPMKLKEKIIGFSSASWSEFNVTPEQTYQHIFPRIAAYSELGWTDKHAKEYDYFLERLEKLCSQWDKVGLSIETYFRTSKNKSEFSTAGFYNLPQFRSVYNFNSEWRFHKGKAEGAESIDFDDDKWMVTNLPDGMELLPAEASGCINYQGEAWYRKHFNLPSECIGKRLVVHFEGIMGKSKVWVNGILVKESFSGYLPLIMDISGYVFPDAENVIAVCTDNSDEPNYPPGKSQDVLDFTYFGGIYRDVWLYTTNDIFITDPNEEDKTAGGGVFVAYKNVSEQSADVIVRADVKNLSDNKFTGRIVYELWDKDNRLVTSGISWLRVSKSSSTQTEEQTMKVSVPHLWSPSNPYLYNLVVKIVDNGGKEIDGFRQRVGIRSIEFRGKEGLYLNGKHYDKPLMGANRHQDFAFIGHAVPNSLHWRDAKKLKDLGMEVIRSAHFPQDPAWMDACDELGLFMIVTTPGWQFWNETPSFEKGVCDNIRQMVRRDRNHACVFLWEPVLNETWYPDYFAKKVRDIVDEEYPYPSCYSACDYRSRGREFYNVWYENAINFHEESPVYANSDTDHITFFQREWGDCVDDWETHNGPSRASMRWGETPMLIQSNHYAKTNFRYISYDAFFRTNPQFIGGCLWHPFDHQRGYHPDPFYGGIMDNFRQPKTSYYMFKSFRSPNTDSASIAETGPFIHIANEMTPFSPEDVTVFSNCEKVVLTVNKDGRQFVHERKRTDGMPYPPIVFEGAFRYVEDKIMSDADNETGVNRQQDSYLLAEGYIGNKKVAECMKRPARRPERIILQIDDEGKRLRADGSDIVVIIASVVDKNGQVKRLNNSHIRFSIEGEGSLIGDEQEYANPMEVVWGTAPVLVRATHNAGKIKVYAEMDYKGSQRPISGHIEFFSRPSEHSSCFSEKESQAEGRKANIVNRQKVPESSTELRQEIEKLRLELNTLKLKNVSIQQTEFNTAKEHNLKDEK